MRLVHQVGADLMIAAPSLWTADDVGAHSSMWIAGHGTVAVGFLPAVVLFEAVMRCIACGSWANCHLGQLPPGAPWSKTIPGEVEKPWV